MDTKLEQHDIIILGGGLAGLSASKRCKAPVFEAAPHSGGAGFSDMVDGFVFDRGIHVLNTKSPKFLAFLQDLGVDMGLRNRVAYIYSHKRYTAYPFQVNTAGLPLGLRARCVLGFIQREGNPEPTNYEEWMHRNIGKGFANAFLLPYSEKFWGVHPSEMTFEWTGTKVPVPSTWQVLRGAVWSRQTAIGSNSVFHYPQNGPGYATIANAIKARAGDVYRNHRAISVDAAKRLVVFENGRTIRYRVLLSTIPLTELVHIMVDAPAEVRTAATKLRANSILVVNLGIGRPGLSGKHWIHFPEKDTSFFRISFPHNFSPGCAPAGTSSISAEVAYHREFEIDRSTIFERVIEDLQRVGVLGMHEPIVVKHLYDIKYAYCIYDKNRKEAVGTIKDWLDSFDIIPSGRFGLWTYFWSDEAINSGTNSALKAMRRLGVEIEEPITADDVNAA